MTQQPILVPTGHHPRHHCLRDNRHNFQRKSRGQIKTGFSGAYRRAGITNLRPRDYAIPGPRGIIPRIAIYRIYALGRLGGWKSERMVLRYADVNAEELASTINALPGENPVTLTN